MIDDALLRFFTAQSATATATSSAVEVPEDIGMSARAHDGAPLCVAIVPTTDVAGTSLTFTLSGSDTATGTFKDIAATAALTAEQVNAGVAIPIPVKHPAFLKLKMTAASITAGAITASITDNIDANEYWTHEVTFD
jgi:hypothetical protein